MNSSKKRCSGKFCWHWHLWKEKYLLWWIWQFIMYSVKFYLSRCIKGNENSQESFNSKWSSSNRLKIGQTLFINRFWPDTIKLSFCIISVHSRWKYLFLKRTWDQMIEIDKIIHSGGGPSQKSGYCAQRLLNFKRMKIQGWDCSQVVGNFKTFHICFVFCNF